MPAGAGVIAFGRHAVRVATVVELGLVGSFAGAAEPSGAAVMDRYDVETPVPFVLPSLDGAPVALEALEGRVVMVNFWATWCGPCVRELPSLQRLAEAYVDAPFELVAVDAGESPDAVRAFLKRLDLDPSFTVAFDTDGATARDWGVFAWPSTFLIDPDGGATHVRYGEADWDSPEVRTLIDAMLPSARADGGATSAASAAAPPLELASAPPEALAVPAAPGAREPSLAMGTDGTVYLGWMEPAANGATALRLSRLEDSAWTAPTTIASGDDWFVNWADFPSLAAFGDGGLAAWWPVVGGDDPYAYDLHVSLSSDGGRSWNEPVVPHDDGTRTQHGLASMAAWPDGRLFVTWLDGRVNAEGVDPASMAPLPTTDMTLRSALIGADTEVVSRELLDERVCTCCATAALRTGDAVLVAYRDRSEAEVRDITTRRFEAGEWSDPAPLHEDGWTIVGCPINGPALAGAFRGDGDAVAAAWFTAADAAPQVLLARSRDGGRGFAEPVRVDDGRPLGRVDVVLLDDGAALVSWLEATNRGEELRYRRVAPDGTPGESRTLAVSGGGRTMGFPRALKLDEEVLFAWTRSATPTDPGAISTALVRP